ERRANETPSPVSSLALLAMSPPPCTRYARGERRGGSGKTVCCCRTPASDGIKRGWRVMPAPPAAKKLVFSQYLHLEIVSNHDIAMPSAAAAHASVCGLIRRGSHAHNQLHL